jgi:hypothetical protein
MPDRPADAADLGRRLAGRDPVSPAARARYEQLLRALLDERIGPAARAGSLVAGVVCVLFGGWIGYAVLSDRQAYAYWPNPVLGAVVGATAVAAGVALVNVAVRGVYSRHREGRWAARSGAVMLLAWGLYMLLAAAGVPDELRAVFLGLGLACLGAAAFVAHRLAAAHAQLVLEKRLLELEDRLADLADRLDRR